MFSIKRFFRWLNERNLPEGKYISHCYFSPHKPKLIEDENDLYGVATIATFGNLELGDWFLMPMQSGRKVWAKIIKILPPDKMCGSDTFGEKWHDVEFKALPGYSTEFKPGFLTKKY